MFIRAHPWFYKSVNILFAIKTMDNVKGGAERVLADIATGLCDAGHDVSLLTFDSPGAGSFYPLHDKIRRLSCPIGDPHSETRLWELLRRVRGLRREIRRADPAIVIAFMHSMFIPVAFALIGTNIPVIASEHIVPLHYAQKKGEFFLLVAAGVLVRRITVLSERIIRLYPKILRHKMTAIPNPVRQPLTLAGPVPHRRKTILSIGRLHPQKDQKTLIAAFAMLAAHYPDWDLRIIGEGILSADLQRQIAVSGLTGRITLAGPRAAIDEEYQSAALFALPSLYESFGLVTVEAMAHGLAVIGFADCEGTNEVIADGVNGLLAAGPDRAAALAAGLDRLMASPELRRQYGQAGLQTAALYRPETILARWESLIAEVAA